MAKARPSRPRPLTLRSLTAPVHAHKKMGQPLDFIHATGPSFRYRKAAWMIVHPHGFVGTFNVTASWMQTVACAVCIRVQTAIQKSCQKSYLVVFADNSSRWTLPRFCMGLSILESICPRQEKILIISQYTCYPKIILRYWWLAAATNRSTMLNFKMPLACWASRINGVSSTIACWNLASGPSLSR